MKIRVFNINYLFENDSKYQREYIIDQLESEDMTYQQAYDKEIQYLDTIREVIVDCDEDINDYFPHQVQESLFSVLQNETGEYIQKFEYEILAD